VGAKQNSLVVAALKVLHLCRTTSIDPVREPVGIADIDFIPSVSEGSDLDEIKPHSQSVLSYRILKLKSPLACHQNTPMPVTFSDADFRVN